MQSAWGTTNLFRDDTLVDTTNPDVPNTLNPRYTMLNGIITPKFPAKKERTPLQIRQARLAKEWSNNLTYELPYADQVKLRNARNVNNFLSADIREKSIKNNQKMVEDVKLAMIDQLTQVRDNLRAIEQEQFKTTEGNEAASEEMINELKELNFNLVMKLNRLNSLLKSQKTDVFGEKKPDFDPNMDIDDVDSSITDLNATMTPQKPTARAEEVVQSPTLSEYTLNIIDVDNKAANFKNDLIADLQKNQIIILKPGGVGSKFNQLVYRDGQLKQLKGDGGTRKLKDTTLSGDNAQFYRVSKLNEGDDVGQLGTLKSLDETGNLNFDLSSLIR